MKTRISLLVACLTIVGIARPTDAEIIKSASPPQASTRAKSLETILRESGLCGHYPAVVKTLNNNVIQIATYGDRQLSDKETRLLALNLAKLVSTNVEKATQVKVRLYDPASTRYWRDLVLSPAQISTGLKSGPEQDQILDSINILNNLGLVDGPHLETRVELYKRILKMKTTKVDIGPCLSKLAQIEAADKNKENIDAQVTALNTSVSELETIAYKPISSNVTSDIKSSDLLDSLKQVWQEASDRQAKVLKAVEDAEQEQRELALPEAWDNDAQARYDNKYEGAQRKIDAALADWNEARRSTDLAYQQLRQTQKHY